MPILLAVSPLAAMRSAPTMTALAPALLHHERRHRVGDERRVDARRGQFPRSDAGALEERTRFAGDGAEGDAFLAGDEKRRERRPVAARRHAPRVADRHHRVSVGEERERVPPDGAPGGLIGGEHRVGGGAEVAAEGGTLVRTGVDGGGHAVERPEEIDGGRARRAQARDGVAGGGFGIGGIYVVAEGEEDAVGRRVPDRRSAAHAQAADGLGHRVDGGRAAARPRRRAGASGRAGGRRCRRSEGERSSRTDGMRRRLHARRAGAVSARRGSARRFTGVPVGASGHRRGRRTIRGRRGTIYRAPTRHRHIPNARRDPSPRTGARHPIPLINSRAVRTAAARASGGR